MNLVDIFIIIGCAGFGYWLIGSIVGSKPTKTGGVGGASGSDGDSGDSGDSGDKATTTNWYQILGVSEYAKVDEIEAAYRKKLTALDRVADAGQKTQLLHAAYQIGMKLYR